MKTRKIIALAFLQVIALTILSLGVTGAVELTPTERGVLTDFDQALTQHTTTVKSARAFSATDEQHLVTIARERRAIMKRLIREDPEQAFARGVDRTTRAQVSKVVQNELEENISGMGSLHVLITRPLDEAVAPIIKRHVTIDGKTYLASTWGDGLQARPSTTRSVHGVAIDGVMALSPNRLRVLSRNEVPGKNLLGKEGKRIDDKRCAISGRAAGFNQEPQDNREDVWVESGNTIHALCQAGHIILLEGDMRATEDAGVVLNSPRTTGTKSLLYMIARCADDTVYPQTVADANSMMVTVNTYFKDCSWNLTEMTWTIVEIILPKTKAEYQALGDTGDTTLLTDARAAAKAAGQDTINFDLDIVRHPSLFGGWSGQGYVGGKGTWLQSSSSATAVHELGHNYGLLHANFWSTNDTSVIGSGGNPGWGNKEYGDPFSEMGGSGQFSGYEKWKLDWIPTVNIQTMTTSGTYRVYACDTTIAPTSGKMYGLRITKDSIKDYWITHRQEFNSNKWAESGVFLHWDPWQITNDNINESNGGTHLLDTTPGTSSGKNDAALVCGRTFSDLVAGIHVTPMSLNSGTTPPSIDVVVNIGSFSGNRAPVVSVSASATAVALNAAVTFTATASDPDGDSLAIYWDFGDTNFSFNTLTPSKSWGTKNEYPVRVIVSDMKGGTSSATAIINVGGATNFRISGTVRSGGVGVEGVRVHRGQTAGSVWTNSDGTYSLTNLAANLYTVQAIGLNATYTPDGFSNDVILASSDATGIDFKNGNSPPTIATVASATLNPVVATTSALSVLGADDGTESNLTYFWSTNGSVPASVSFFVNNSNAAKATTATFIKAGSYPLIVTVSDAEGLTASSTVTVIVNQTLTTVSVSPTSATVAPSGTQAFTATGRDQFAITMISSPTWAWSVASGGSVSNSGIFTGGSTAGGPHTLTVSSSGKSATSIITVNDLPTISAIAAQSTLPDTVLGPITFTIGDIQTTASSLTLTKQTSSSSLIPSGNIVFGGSGANRTVTITPATGQLGTATITITVRDAHNGTASAAFDVTVAAAGSASAGDSGGGKKKCGFGNGVGVLLLLMALGLIRLRHSRR